MSHPNAPARVSHYRIVRPLGSGGMGDVYLAEDLHLERQVAIKFLNVPDDERARHRLLNEARSIAAVDHPFICAVYEVGHDDVGGDFVVMQYAEGETLAARLSRGPLTPSETVHLGIDVAAALSAAHRHGIVHRDLKPQNIILGHDGRPKLLDFGISKRVTTAEEAAEAPTSTQLTRPHAMIGTPGYMSPEQVQGQAADNRSDLFALGCVLFECLTGRRAFDGQTSGEIFGRILHVEAPRASALVPAVPADLDHVVGRLLEKVPADRFQTAEEVEGALRLLGTRTHATGTNGVAVQPSRGRRPAVWFAGAIAVGLLAFATWMWFGRYALPEPPADATRWYDQGVEALREGTYASARAALEEAVRIFPDYAQAYSRLAEACSELDDDRAAQTALLRVSSLVPNTSRLPADDRLRLEAVRAGVLRDYEVAIAALTELVDRHPADAGLRLDLGRAEEAAGRMGQAREHYAKAAELDPHYASARLRLGTAESQAGRTSEALASFDEAIRLYRAASRPEGEAEAWLRKGARQAATGDYEGAHTSLARAIEISADARYLSQRVRARFDLARITMAQGRFGEAQTIATDAVAEASTAGADGVAAVGLISLANSLTARRRYEEADAHLERAIRLAAGVGATRTEMRARLQQASLRLDTQRPAETLALGAEPLRFFAEGRYRNLEAQAKNVLSRAYERLEQYQDAQRLATEVLAHAEAIGDATMLSVSLENLAGQLTRLGRLPEALRHRERAERIHRDQGSHATLKYDLPNRAELLIDLGRGAEAESILAEVETARASGNAAYGDRARRVASLRTLQAATEHRFADVDGPAGEAIGASEPPDDTALLAMAQREYARAARGLERVPPDVLASWPTHVASVVARRAVTYWVTRTLLARREPLLALTLLTEALADPVAADNVELRWRLHALAARAVDLGAVAPSHISYASRAAADISQLEAEFGSHATAYFARPDLADLRTARSR